MEHKGEWIWAPKYGYYYRWCYKKIGHDTWECLGYDVKGREV